MSSRGGVRIRCVRIHCLVTKQAKRRHFYGFWRLRSCLPSAEQILKILAIRKG